MIWDRDEWIQPSICRLSAMIFGCRVVCLMDTPVSKFDHLALFENEHHTPLENVAA